MQAQIGKLKQLLGEIMDLYYTEAILGWDQQTYMPSGGAEDRGDQLATISQLRHIKMTSEEMGKLLDALEPSAKQMDPDSDDACLVRLVRHQYDKRTRIPPDWVAEFARVTAVAHNAWQKARAESDYKQFQPHLEKIVDLRRQYAEFFSPYDHVYDPLLDDYERGMKTAEVREIFNKLRPLQVELIQAIVDSDQVDDSFLHQSYQQKEQWDFGVEVVSRFGYDWNRGREDTSAHPFTTSLSPNDVRITTRFDPEYVSTALFGTMHEGGHALYEQNFSKGLRRTPLADGASMAVHESQSRLWENLVGRSYEFWTYHLPRLKEYFPTQLGNINLDSFYKGINKVTPSLVRVEADEATYNLHVMLRFELEIAMMEGSIMVKDLPDAWNERVREYLGLTPPNDALGVLQDVHWSGGSIGYFPTYALGNLISVQIWDGIHRDIIDLDDQISKGEFGNLLNWLKEKLYTHGSKFEPQVIVEKITGRKIDPQPYVRYLQTKYKQIYNL
jgi:carboxypeptidase Taq